MKTSRNITVGERGITRLPWSEVCVHMKVADAVMGIELVSDRAVQLYSLPYWEPFSFPILTGEAGVFTGPEGPYFYPYDAENGVAAQDGGRS